jgi:hypothetical protein
MIPDHDPATGEVIESSGQPDGNLAEAVADEPVAAPSPLDTDIDLTIPTFLKRSAA